MQKFEKIEEEIIIKEENKIEKTARNFNSFRR